MLINKLIRELAIRSESHLHVKASFILARALPSAETWHSIMVSEHDEKGKAYTLGGMKVIAPMVWSEMATMLKLRPFSLGRALAL